MLDKNTKNFSESFKKLLWLEDLLKSCFLNVQFKMQIVVQLFFHFGESRMLNVLSWSLVCFNGAFIHKNAAKCMESLLFVAFMDMDVLISDVCA